MTHFVMESIYTHIKQRKAFKTVQEKRQTVRQLVIRVQADGKHAGRYVLTVREGHAVDRRINIEPREKSLRQCEPL